MRKPSPSMIVALLALFVALGGVGAAATGNKLTTGKPGTTATHAYAAHARLLPFRTQHLLTLPGLGQLTAMCESSGGATFARTRFRSSANGLQVFGGLSNGTSNGDGPSLLNPMNRGQVRFDLFSGAYGAYHYTYSILGKSATGHALGTINIFGSGGGGASGSGDLPCQFQVSAMLQPS